jgi:aminopeptidase N
MPATAESDPYPQSDRIIIRLPGPAIGATALTLRFAFSGNLSTTVIGFYGSAYTNGSVSVPIVQTKFEPSFARTAFPCFDEPALKATFNLSLSGLPEGYVALGNMPALGGSSTGGVTAFERSPVMSTCEGWGGEWGLLLWCRWP